VRTTVTLDEDVAGRGRARPASFRIEPCDLGALRPGLSLDNVSQLLELEEGPEAR
jgi:hypothetical protein